MELMEPQGATLWYGLCMFYKTSLTVQMEFNTHKFDQVVRLP